MSVDPVSLAITAALTAANMAMTASRTIEGPRLDDTAGSVADYGTPLNYFVGRRVLSCPAFFAKPIVERRKKRKGKAGKQVSYSGFGTWACQIADHEIAGVSKIWFDNHLVFDGTGGQEKIYPLAQDYELTANMRLYLGTEDQEPDPDMLAFIEARDGPGTCPAYRGTSYIYFENVPLEQLGNRFPSVTVLARTGSPPVFRGWYAKARIELVEPSISLSAATGWRVTPSGGAEMIDRSAPAGGIVWPGTGNSEFPDGIPKGVYDAGDNAVTLYWCDPAIMNAEEIELVMQFPSGSVSSAMAARFSWQWWNAGAASPPLKEASTIVNPGVETFSFGDPFDVIGLWPMEWYFNVAGDGEPPAWSDEGDNAYATLEQLLAMVSERAGIDPSDCDWNAVSQLTFSGYNWTQGSGRQILEPVLDLFDVDIRPHDFGLEALPRGSSSAGLIATGEMVREKEAGTPYQLKDTADSDLPRRMFLVYADDTADQNPNVAMPPGPDPVAAGTVRETSIDMQTLALTPDEAQRLAERRLRRLRFGRTSASFDMTRQRLAIEPGDVMTPGFDGRSWSMRNTKLTIGANGVLTGEWERDMAALAVLSGSSGGQAAGFVPDQVPTGMATLGLVMDLPLLADAHEQSAPLAYVAAGPGEPGIWTGADFAQSETGELDSYATDWAAIASGEGSVIGECVGALGNAAQWVPDMGNSVTVTINAGQLTAASLEDLLIDPLRNLAAVRSGEGWELVQFMTPVLTGELTYTITGFLRGVRGSEWAITGHAAGDAFVLLESASRRTMGAGEIGDTDWYVVSATGQALDQDEAFAVTYTGASHKPLAPVAGTVTFDGNDVVFDATRRTRIGGATLDGQDVPLGETAESWALDLIDNTTSPPAVKRTITGASLPLVYSEADQIADWGTALNAASPIVVPEANLFQVSPPLSLRGYPLNFPEQSL